LHTLVLVPAIRLGVMSGKTVVIDAFQQESPTTV
jgi:hypothetical protein